MPSQNDQVRVLDVVIEAGAREPEHTHQAVSVMVVDQPARIRYYQGDALLFESRARSESQPGACAGWNPRARTLPRTSMSIATTRSGLSSSNPGAVANP